MSDAKPEAMTDPARELVEICQAVHDIANQYTAGKDHLAQRFGVEPWSKEFYQIVFAISERVEFLASVIETLDLDDDFKADIVGHVRDILQAFSSAALQNAWHVNGQAHVGPSNVQPLKAVSGLVRARVGYKKLSDEEVGEIKHQVSLLHDWLVDHQIVEQDFIRQALIDGLRSFAFRLDKLRWLGWGYTLDSLREVIAAYMLLERGNVDPAVNPDAAAVLQKVGAMLKSVYERVQTAKTVTESADWLLKVYAAGSLAYHGKPFVTALLGSG